jgi:hypothetical protein
MGWDISGVVSPSAMAGEGQTGRLLTHQIN